MGLTAIISSSAGSASSASAGVTSLITEVGLGIGGVFVAAALVILLAYLDLFNASDIEDEAAFRTIVATVVPLFVAFAGTILFKALQLV